MKLLPYVCLNLATVAAALVVYDGLRGEDTTSASLVGGGVDAVAIERRLQALEHAQRPLLRAEGLPADLLRRIEDLDARVKALAGARREAPMPSDGPQEARAALPDPGAAPTAEAVAAFRRLQEAVREEDRRVREGQRIDALLAKQGIRLGAQQRESVVAVCAAFETRRDQVWSEVKMRAREGMAQADWKAILEETSAQLERELGERLARALPAGEAEAVARALTPALR